MCINITINFVIFVWFNLKMSYFFLNILVWPTKAAQTEKCLKAYLFFVKSRSYLINMHNKRASSAFIITFV